MTELKIGRDVFDITERDVVLFNGACWMLITRKVFDGLHNSTPTMPKTLCEKLLKKKVLILEKKEDEYVTASGKQMGLYYYKFDVEKLNDFVN